MVSLNELSRKGSGRLPPIGISLNAGRIHESDEKVAKVEATYAGTIVGVLERLNQICVTADTQTATQELLKSYPALLSIYQDGIESFKERAKQRELPWIGTITGSLWIDSEDGSTGGGGEGLTIGENSIIYSSRDDTDLEITRIEMVGSKDAQEVMLVRLSTSRSLGSKEGEITKCVEINFNKGAPTEFSVFSNPKAVGGKPPAPRMEFKLKF